MDHWKKFWEQQTKPLHQREEAAFYALHGAELAVLTGDCAGLRVLEIGCGDGALFTSLGFPASASYVGVDLSQSMLDVFRQRHPGLDLRLGDAIDIPSKERFDLVFSNGVVQYLDLQAFCRHLKAVGERLAAGGRYVCGSVPARERRSAYVTGLGAFPARREPVRTVKEVLSLIAGRSSLGQWYGLRDIEAAARQSGLDVQVYGSLCYLYRYHLVLSPI
jgi:cyclopropane fatty-acyl-phospholipid synthase-like methyltransferase